MRERASTRTLPAGPGRREVGIGLRRLNETAEVGRALISQMPGAGLLILDAQLRVLLAEGDPYADRSKWGVPGRELSSAVAEGTWEVLAERYEAALAGTPQEFEFDAPNGYRGSHRVRITPIRDGGEVVGLLVLSGNITEEVATRRRLGESERLQNAVLEALEEGIIVLDPEGRLLQATPAACAILGVEPGEAASDDALLHFAPAAGSGDRSADIAGTVLVTGRSVRDVPVEIDRPDGTRVSLSVNFLPLREDEGPVSGLVISLRDVTAQREHERTVNELRANLREAQEVAGLACWEWRCETDELVVLQALADSEVPEGPGGTLQDLIELLPEDERETVREDFAALERGERDAFVRRHRYELASGPSWLETRSRAVRDADGRLLCVRGTTQDVTEQEQAARSAAEAHELVQSTLDSMPMHIAVLDARGEIVMTNRAWDRFGEEHRAGTSCATGRGANYLEACDAAIGDRWAARAAAGLREVIAGRRGEFSLEYPCHTEEQENWYVLRAAPYQGNDAPGAPRVVVSHTDVTARRLAQAEMARQAALIDEVDASVIATDLSGVITVWSHGAEQLFGRTREEAVGSKIDAMVPAPEWDRARVLNPALARRGEWSGEVTLTRKDGSTFPSHVRARRIDGPDEMPLGVVGITIDLTERIAAERELRRVNDYLRAITASMGEGLFTLDSDGRVTYVNAAAERLLGWSFGELQGRVMHDMTHTHRPDGSPLPVEECPIRAAHRDGRLVHVEDEVFIHRNGERLAVDYTAAPFVTDEGVEGCVVVFEDISERKARERALEAESEKLAWIDRIQDALTDERFLLYGQPIIDLGTREVVQRELLLRMRDDDERIIGPGEYLHIAEQYGLIGAIDRWVIEEAMGLASSGQPVEINLSARSVGDPAILEHIEGCLERSGVDPEQIVFEITETALIEDSEGALSFTRRLHELGCRLALDDFGTGYGSFTYLKNLPVDFLKIDVEFVRDLATNPGSQHVVEAVVALARSFGLRTVGEGVEDADTLELLMELGVDYAQGYHVGRPAPLEPPLQHPLPQPVLGAPANADFGPERV